MTIPGLQHRYHPKRTRTIHSERNDFSADNIPRACARDICMSRNHVYSSKYLYPSLHHLLFVQCSSAHSHIIQSRQRAETCKDAWACELVLGIWWHRKAGDQALAPTRNRLPWWCRRCCCSAVLGSGCRVQLHGAAKRQDVLLTLLLSCIGIKQTFIEELVVIPRGKRYTITSIVIYPMLVSKKGKHQS